MRGLTYDTGALIGAARGQRGVWKLHSQAIDRGTNPLVPAPVLAQAWRGGARQALFSRLLAGCTLLDFPVARAYEVGKLLGLAGTSDVVDAAVVLTAAARRDVIVTSDPVDLYKLGEALDVRLRLAVV